MEIAVAEVHGTAYIAVRICTVLTVLLFGRGERLAWLEGVHRGEFELTQLGYRELEGQVTNQGTWSDSG
ncbi:MULTISPECIES: hypothetical protein [unclassified Crossiella]|uniref:hypothetical protein n=1 Tax=unclassified Crossiella TaxID=2620835 RepID=UPI001FFEDB16|nr:MULTISPECIES: hypothetical protein [unclassified Crossiella]MCK2240074.1 hypothetical protein [Crossiella sp. S99.2]MCK2252783.1 hypothetical protein [Crossiella sp. S99.1]